MKKRQLPGKGKDRALATALLRVSEKTVNQEENETDDVLYCGEEEPFYGWTNAVPNPRYSSGKKPKQTSKRKKSNKKNKKGTIDASSELMWGMTGMTLTVVDQQNAYATLRDMYDSYKKNKQVDRMSEQNKIINPETYEYVPWEERSLKKEGESDNESGKPKRVKLSSLQGAPSNRLVEVLEKYMNQRKNSLYSKSSNFGETAGSVAAADMLAYYDRYKWNFAKENKQNIPARKENKRKSEHIIHLPSITSEKKKSNVEPNVKEKLVRYVNGAVHNKRHNKFLRKDQKNAFYIKIHGGDHPDRLPNMVRLERKDDINSKNGEKSDRWIARVIIKEADETGANWFKPYNDSESSSSVIIVPDTRWKQKLGVVKGERDRIQKEMEKLRFQQQQQLKLNQMKKRLMHDNYDVNDNFYRLKQNEDKHHRPTPMFSLVEAAKVSVRQNEESKLKKLKGSYEETKSVVSRLPEIPPTKQSEATTRKTSNKVVVVGTPQVRQILPSSEDEVSPESIEKLRPKNSRLFLKRGVARKSESRVKSLTNSNVRLPVLPKQAKLEKVKKTKKQKSKEKNNDSTSDEEEEDENIHDNSLPLASAASESFRAVLKDGSQHEKKFNVSAKDKGKDGKKQRTKINKQSSKNAEFIRYQVIPQPGLKYLSKTGNTNRRPIHPPHTKNRGQETIQEMIDQEKGVLNSAINHISNKLGYNPLYQDISSDTESFKTALNSAIAQARLIEEHKHNQIPANLTNTNKKGEVIMKRRVVPPIRTTSSVSPQEAEPNQLPLVTNISVSNSGDENNQENLMITSRTVEDKSSKANRTRVKKRAKNATTRVTSKKNFNPMLDDIVLSGDVIIKQRPTPKLLENSFAASITSVKPSRRVVNLIPQRTL